MEKMTLSLHEILTIKSEVEKENPMNNSVNCGDFDTVFFSIINKAIEVINQHSKD